MCSLMGMTKKYFNHPRMRVRVWAKLLLRAVAKSTLGMSLEVAPNLIPTWKMEIFWGPQKDIIHLPPF